MTPPPLPESPIRTHVFVVTYGRSGSTLVQNLLNSLPGYCIRGENANALGPLARAWSHVARSANIRAMAQSGVQTTPEHPWFGAEGISADRWGRALAEAFVREVLAPPPGTRVAGFKEIRWGGTADEMRLILDFAHRFFPGARFVFNTRNPDDVARSAWWAEMPREQALRRIAEMNARFEAYLRDFPGRAIALHYDDYVADPEGLRPLFTFLGEEWDAQSVAKIMATRLTHLKDSPG